MNGYEKVFELGISEYGDRISVFKCDICFSLVEERDTFNHDKWHSELALGT